MTGTLADDRTKRDTVAMLRRVQQQQDVHQLQAGGDQQEEEDEEGQGDSVDDEESARLLAAVGDDTLSLSSLSPEQQRLFLRAIHNGTLSRHIPVAVPWWVPARGREGNNTNGLERETREWEPQLENRLVEEVEREQSEEEQQSSAFVHSLPPLSSILRTEPSPAVPCQLLELVYGYCYVWRLYNCEPDADLPAFLADLVALSPSLAPTASSAPHHQSTTTTLQHCLAHVRSLPSLYQSPHFSALVLRDCSQLCLNSALLFRALREVSGWCGAATGADRGKLKRTGKKVWFWCVWLQDRGVDAMRGVGEEAQAVWKDEVALCRERGEQR